MNRMAALRRNICRFGFIAAVLAVSACGSDEPPFPPTANGPDLTTVPEGLGSDSANAQYSDQPLEPQMESVPRPEPAPPPPKAAEGKTPEAAPAGEAQPSAETGTPATATPSEPAAAEPTPAPAPAANDKSGYPDINTVPMERPTPEQNMEPDQPPADQAPADQTPTDQAPADQPPANDLSTGSPQSFNMVPNNVAPNVASRLAVAAADRELTIITAAGDVDLDDVQDDAAQIAQEVGHQAGAQPDPLFGRTTLPPYTSYDDAQKQARAQQLYHSPYSGALPAVGGNGPAASGPIVLSGTSAGGMSTGSSAGYGSQAGIYVNYAGAGPQGPAAQATGPQGFGQPVAGFTGQLTGQPVGLIYFSDGSAKLSADDRRVLKQVARMQKSYGGVVRVVGHASSRTADMSLDRHDKANEEMSRNRARAVAAYLVRLGVDAGVIQVAGVSDSRPVYPEIMPSGEAANRRAEIYLSNN
ncbi:MAG: OmpA family protein [Rhodospirillaceae bacterium]|nr:MAG: OmpA family protein [Rhodospirillaceae bacterium]